MKVDDAERILRRVLHKGLARNRTTIQLVSDLKFAYAVAAPKVPITVTVEDDRIVVELPLTDGRNGRHRLLSPVISSLYLRR